MTQYRYEHPEGKGLGEHHAGRGDLALSRRSAAWQGVVGQGNVEAAEGETSMRDLDMSSGTLVELLEYDGERNLYRVGWIDGLDTERITSIEPDFFLEHFSEVSE